MDASSQNDRERLIIDRFSTWGPGRRGLDYETNADLGVKVAREGLDLGERGTVLIALDALGGDSLDVVTVEQIPDPLQQMDEAIEVLTTARRKLAALLARGEGEES